MTAKKPPQPKTAKDLAAEKLFKISAEIDLGLAKEFKALCAINDVRMKVALQEAMKLYLYGDKAKAVDQKGVKK